MKKTDFNAKKQADINQPAFYYLISLHLHICNLKSAHLKS
jgi:hypothetical protein